MRTGPRGSRFRMVNGRSRVLQQLPRATSCTHNVIRLQVAVHDVQTVQVPERSGEIVCDKESLDPQLLLLFALHVLEFTKTTNLALGLLPNAEPRRERVMQTVQHNEIAMLVWIRIRSSSHFDNIGVLYHRKESRFNRKVDNTGNETVRVGLNLLTKLLDGVSGILSLALLFGIYEYIWLGYG